MVGMRSRPSGVVHEMKNFLLLLLLCVAVAAARPAPGQDLHPGIIGKDDRVRLEAAGPPWDAVGQVNIGGYRMTTQCTGILVAPNLVVTAAHCVMDPWRKAAYPLHDIHFAAGVRGGANKGQGTAICLHFLRNYQYIGPEKILPTMPAQKVPLASLATDAVAIVLGTRIAVEPAPLAEDAAPQPGLRLVHVAYAADHRFMPWAHFDCHLFPADPQTPLWFNDCDTHPASSGGPLFIRTAGTPKLAAIMLGAGGHDFNVALPVSAWLELTQDTHCP